jgi:hypothetical protein
MLNALVPMITQGSVWHRWDPHLHAPGTLLSDQFAGNWEDYLKRVEDAFPLVEALGVTDYFCIQTYREARKRKASGRLPNVRLLFPNVEMRLDIKTEKKKPINIHLLFSPEDINHENEIERILSHLVFEFQGKKYRCNIAELTQLGRAFDPKQTDDRTATRVGANQFKVTLGDIRELFRSEKWMQKYCLVAVSGSSIDGTAGLQDDDSYAATRREIERFAHVIFASTPSQRDFWLGKSPNNDRETIERTYGSLKPCLHGSDAHREERIASPDLGRYCWIKGDLIFESLRQVVIEPEERVWIGETMPNHNSPTFSITSIQTEDTPWLANDTIPLNEGLVAVIGSRGSGKTALADIVAAGAGGIRGDLGESSFLGRASSPIDYIGAARVSLGWNDGSRRTAPLLSHVLEEEPDEDVSYLSQHFVEQLCSSFGLAGDLRHEMERVVFEATDTTERLGASSFEELTEVLLEPIRHRRNELRETIIDSSQEVVREDLLKERLLSAKKEYNGLNEQLGDLRRKLGTLLPKGKEKRADRLTEIEEACSTVEGKVEALRRQLKAVEDLTKEVDQIRSTKEPSRLKDMQRRFVAAELSTSEWVAFEMVFKGDVDAVLRQRKNTIEKEIKAITEGNPKVRVDPKRTPLASWSLNLLKTTREAAKKEVGIDTQQQKKYDDVQRIIKQVETSIKRVKEEIRIADGADSRRHDLIDARRKAYAQVFDTFAEEEEVLNRLYEPLKREISRGAGALSKLAFVVRRSIQLESWVGKGEQLLDLRKDSGFRGHGALASAAKKYLFAAWSSGASKDVAKAMDDFRTDHQADLKNAMPSSITSTIRSEWYQSLAAWLYNTDHIRIEYGINYDGVPIERLSPGTRGIVLLLLYLAIDQQDRRPLIIDQPEENLDPNSVFEELVPQFREARKRRQVIVITHNANLVVNTDADQVIVATAIREEGSIFPRISYEGGSLENKYVRDRVCEILEGGERAFLERERRYRLRWDADEILPKA